MDRTLPRSALIAITVLRVLIGWHFLYEGIAKLTAPSWSAAGYMRVSRGPFADFFRWIASQPNLFFLFALTESENRMPVDAWLAPSQILRLDDRFIERDIREFCLTLLRYHSIAFGYPYPPPADRYDEVMRAAPGLLSRALSQHRLNVREVIRLAVTVADLLYLYPDYAPAALLDELAHGLRLA